MEGNKAVGTEASTKSLTIGGGLAGIISIVSYITIVFTSLSNQLTFLLAMFFPIFGIVFLFSVKEYINYQLETYASNLGFVFGSLAFTICAIFLSAQIAVQSEMDFTKIPADDALKTIKESIRLIDMGMDVAWDMFIGTYLILFLIATLRIKKLKVWGLVMGTMGFVLIVLNVMTFPIPPADAKLFDLGPFIALMLLGLAFWILMLGLRMKSGEEKSGT